MKKILILGTGRISGPCIRYLSNQNDFVVTAVSNEREKLSTLTKMHPNVKFRYLDINDVERLSRSIQENDIVVSLLPSHYNFKIASLCLVFKKHMTTTSYVSDEMRTLDAPAREKELIILNEIGLDPGIDHMSAMKIIHQVYESGGKVREFYSFCGGLPAPANDDNPFRYKFSWNPKGVLMAAGKVAHYLKDERIIKIEGKDLFNSKNIWLEEIEGLGPFEIYANRDSLFYRDIYNLKDARTVVRGTYRRPGWCQNLDALSRLGLLNETNSHYLRGKTYCQMMAHLIKADNSRNIKSLIARRLNTPIDSLVMKNLEWLGLFEKTPIPRYTSLVDILTHLMVKKMSYRKGETDMILLRHKIVVENKGKNKQFISTLLNFGIPYGDTSMARTVGLPIAIAVALIVRGKINLTGVQVPIKKEIYTPVLSGLYKEGIEISESIFAENEE